MICTHIDFTQDDINDATNDDNEVKHVPRVPEVALHGEGKHCCDRRTLDGTENRLRNNH